MNFVLLRTSAFVRNAKKIIKKQPELAASIQATLELLSSDPFDPSLEAADNALMLLDQELGILDDSIVASINELNLDQLRFLIRGVINFETTADLQKFLDSLS